MKFHPMGELLAGDRIAVWWKGDERKPNTDVITALHPYTGHIKELAGAKIASFKFTRLEMTLEPGAIYEVHGRARPVHEVYGRFSPHPLDNLGDR